MGQLGDLAALVVFVPGGMLQGIDDLIKPVGIWPILVVVVMGHVPKRIGAGGFEAAIIVIEMLDPAAGQAMIDHLAKSVVAKGLVSPVRITRLPDAVVPIPIEVGPMAVLVFASSHVKRVVRIRVGKLDRSLVSRMSDFLDGAGPRITLVRGGIAAGICVAPAIEAGGIGDGGGVVLVIGPAHPAERAAHDEAACPITARFGPVTPVRIAVSR